MQPLQTFHSGVQGLDEVQFSGHGAGGDFTDLIGFPGTLSKQVDGLGACDGRVDITNDETRRFGGQGAVGM